MSVYKGKPNWLQKYTFYVQCKKHGWDSPGNKLLSLHFQYSKHDQGCTQLHSLLYLQWFATYKCPTGEVKQDEKK